MKEKFTIGEMAKLHQIRESTLRYYDEKGIFQPKFVDPQTNYRYYTIGQFSMLSIIKFLREMKIPLKDIKLFVENRTPALALDLLENQMELLMNKQREIEYMMSMMQHKIGAIHEGIQQPSSAMTIKVLQARPIRAVAIDGDIPDELFEFHLNELQKEVHPLFAGDIGVSIPKEAILQQNYQQYNRLFILLDPQYTEVDSYSHIDEGMFACMYHYGSYETSIHTYGSLHEEIERQGYEIVGDTIEVGIIDYALTPREEEYVTEIQVPVSKKK
ncbi:MerR family transcriptional regulator [Priestia taiwanensis]|uniref:MerR family transcriptional regulator n=1 Tax=Priestia taiwanensis TaxID=1347902 RepID=A0A917ER99_9BACI|nr:MerR family transcriptional regulator [Priestia taiwanensis]MBM7364699.1 effector-binding domain-containing protein [Priestia taiwanensis]GGE78970.1 MerR family transcriptional regulator [Priestia taiwanensis]